MCVCLPVGLVVRIDSSEALAPSDGFGGEASDRSNGQRHGGESSGWTPCTEQRRGPINRLLTPQNDWLTMFLSSQPHLRMFFHHLFAQFFVCHNWLVCHKGRIEIWEKTKMGSVQQRLGHCNYMPFRPQCCKEAPVSCLDQKKACWCRFKCEFIHMK